MNLSAKHRLTDRDHVLEVPKRQGEKDWECQIQRGKSYCIQDGYTKKTYCRAQGTVFIVLG